MITVSNTQVTAYLTCGRLHDYQFNQRLEPREFKVALYRGIVGHSALEAYYNEIKDNAPVGTALAAAKSVLTKTLQDLPGDAFTYHQIVASLFPIMDAYAAHYVEEPFRVIDVEEGLKIPIDKDVEYAMFGSRRDLLVEMTKGEYRGDIVIVDHKFLYNFKNRIELALDGQIPKYIKVARAKGIYVTKGMFNMVRYRSDAREMFKREFIKPTKIEIDTIWDEQRETAIEIATNPKPVRRTLSPIICKMCNYADLCKSDLLGQDTTIMKRTEFQPSTYGYDHLQADDD